MASRLTMRGGEAGDLAELRRSSVQRAEHARTGATTAAYRNSSKSIRANRHAGRQLRSLKILLYTQANLLWLTHGLARLSPLYASFYPVVAGTMARRRIEAVGNAGVVHHQTRRLVVHGVHPCADLHRPLPPPRLVHAYRVLEQKVEPGMRAEWELVMLADRCGRTPVDRSSRIFPIGPLSLACMQHI